MATAETGKNFDAQESIAIDILSTYQDDQSVASEFKITVNHTEALYVVDVIAINNGGKI